jgi:hypothetical protein
MVAIKNILDDASDFQKWLRQFLGIKTKNEKNLDAMFAAMLDRIIRADEYWRHFGCRARFRKLQGWNR